MAAFKCKTTGDQATEPDRANKPPRKRRRRWLRFSLRAAIAVQVALCIWLAVVVNAARRQKAVVEQLREPGRFVFYDYYLNDRGGLDMKAEPRVPQWLLDALGVDMFYTPIGIVADRGDTIPASLTDDDLAVIGTLLRLRYLLMEGNDKITDDGLAHLSHLRELRSLSLKYTNVHSTGLVHLADLHKLEVLDLQNTHIGDADLLILTRLPNLQQLGLGNTAIGDEGIAVFSQSETLKHLDMHGTRISDAGLKQISKIGALRTLNVSGTAVTTDGRERLKEALPNCRVR